MNQYQDQPWSWIFERPFEATTARTLLNEGGGHTSGAVYSRDDIAKRLIDQYGLGGGDGQTASKAKVARILKKQLPREGEGVKNSFEWVTLGRYRYCGAEEDEHNSFHDSQKQDNSDADSLWRLEPERVLGEGACEVYAWCLPQDQNGDSSWPIKIGSAGEGGFNRRWRDFCGNLPVVPKYLIRVGFASEADAAQFERVLHFWFRNRDRQVEDIPGVEWFRTNPDEIVEAIQQLNPRIGKQRVC